MAITREEVFGAAEALVGEGEEPTYITVRERLGSGSFSTVSKYLREWKAGAKGKDEGAAHVEVPAEFRSSLERFGVEVWRTLGAFARTEIEATRTAFEERMRERDEELERAAGTVDTLQAELEGMTGERERLYHELERLKGELAEEKGKAIERENRFMIAIDERMRFQEEMRELDRALSKATERGSTLEKKIEGMSGRILSLEEDLDQRIEELARTRKERDVARGEVLAATKIEENLRQELKKEEERGKELSGKVDALSARLTEEAVKRATLEERLSHPKGVSS
jgi:chromosome segregation ATPase